MIRSFIAIDLPPGVQKALDGLGCGFQKTDAPVAWVKADRIHLTLKFLGNVSEDAIPEIKAALDRIAAGTVPFRLQAAACGAFPSIKQMRVVWVGLRGDSEPLAMLQKQVEAAMVPFGFPPEDRPFKPHLTLGRVKGRQHLRALQEALLAQQGFETEPFDVIELVLYKSELRPEGARYTPLHRTGFANRPE